MKHRQNGEAYPKYGGKISNVVCDAGAHRHRRKHPLSVSALISSNVLERCFIPYYQQKKRFQGEWHIQERILFPGYVFLIAQNLECLVNGLKKVIGLTKLIGIGDQIVPLVQEEVELLMRIGTDKQLVEMSSGIIENDRVRILSGPLMGMEGNIRRIDRHKRIAYLEIEMFGRTVEMKVGLEIIRKE